MGRTVLVVLTGLLLLVSAVIAAPDGEQSKTWPGSKGTPKATYTVTNTLDDGSVGSLRWAINSANASPGTDLIDFNIAGGGPQTIFPVAQLPPLTDPFGVVIDGFTQPGGATDGGNPPRTANLLIEIDGIAAGPAHGIWIVSSFNEIRGLVINNFEQDGIRIEGAIGFEDIIASDNYIYCCFVGTDPPGLARKGNGRTQNQLWAGVHICNQGMDTYAMHNYIEGCLISANYAEGVAIWGPIVPGDVYMNYVYACYIGTDINGLVDLGNDHEGVCLCEGTHDNEIFSNIISGNDYDGVGIQGYGPDGIITFYNLIYDNVIGGDYNRNPLPNLYHGVAVGEYGPAKWGFAMENVIGPNNVIENNGRDGVSIWEDLSNDWNADANLITQNSMYDNTELGIDLQNDGVTPNDGGDPDIGPNQYVNFPILTGATVVSGNLTVSGVIDIDTDPTQAQVEVFRAAPDPSGHGEGDIYLGTAVPDAAGGWALVLAPSPVVVGDWVTATTTDMNRNTSEFSENMQVTGGEPPWDCEENPPPGKTGGGYEIEPNSECQNANYAECETAYCGYLDIGDFDWWTVTLPSDTCYCLHVRVFADATPGQYAYGCGLDPSLEIYAADCGTLLYANDNYMGTFPDAEGTDAQYSCETATNCYLPGTTLNIKIAEGDADISEGPYLLVINCIECECPDMRDRVECEPQDGVNPSHPPTYWYDVTPGDGTGRCDFHVLVFDSISSHYTNWVEPTGWSHQVHKVGSDWWVSWWSPGCTNPIYGTFRFSFDNPYNSVWSNWVTTNSGTSDPHTGVVDYTDNHADQIDGYGYHVHVPFCDQEPWDHKMHYPQYPDPFGWDVYCWYDPDLFMMGDDWMCSETGWVQDIHFWGSWYDDLVGDIPFWVFRIWSDVPAEQSPTGYSMPGDMLWEIPIETVAGWITIVPEDPSLQGWYNVPEGSLFPNNHMQYFRYDVLLPEELWFHQDEGTIYWLTITPYLADPGVTMWGWKSSLDHWNDAAVWGHGFPEWYAINEPPEMQEPLDLAFVITGGPGVELGACCHWYSTDCVITTQEACEADSGYYLGDGTTCDPNPCYHCCVGASVGNLDCLPGIVDMGDLTILIDHLFISLNPLCCIEEGDVDLSGQPTPIPSDVDMSDLTILIDHLFISLNPLPACP